MITSGKGPRLEVFVRGLGEISHYTDGDGKTNFVELDRERA